MSTQDERGLHNKAILYACSLNISQYTSVYFCILRLQLHLLQARAHHAAKSKFVRKGVLNRVYSHLGTKDFSNTYISYNKLHK